MPTKCAECGVAGWLRERARIRRMQSAGGPKAFENRMFREAKIAEKLANEWEADHAIATPRNWCGEHQQVHPDCTNTKQKPCAPAGPEDGE